MRSWKHILIIILAVIPFTALAQTEEKVGTMEPTAQPFDNERTVASSPIVQTAEPGRTRLGSLIEDPSDSLRKRKKLARRLIIEKGDIQLGLQIAYATLSSDDSELFMLAKNMDATGSYFQVAPNVAYAYRDNHAVGLRFKYAKAQATVDNLDLDLLSDDLKFNLQDIYALTSTYQLSFLHRSYIGLDRRGIFGLYVDVLAGYVHSRTQFEYNAETQDTYTAANKFKCSISPGFVVFPMNNVSVNVSIGIANLTYSRMSYYKNEVCTGYRSSFKMKAGLSVFDLFFGVTFHL